MDLIGLYFDYLDELSKNENYDIDGDFGRKIVDNLLEKCGYNLGEFRKCILLGNLKRLEKTASTCL